MTRYYLDTSVAVHALQGHPAVYPWFEETATHHDVVSSRLLQTELTRVLRRDGHSVGDRDYVLGRIALVGINEATLAIAESFEAHAKTLDSIHMATALLTGSDTVVVSHDATVLRLAEELGLRTLDPVTVS